MTLIVGELRCRLEIHTTFSRYRIQVFAGSERLASTHPADDGRFILRLGETPDGALRVVVVGPDEEVLAERWVPRGDFHSLTIEIDARHTRSARAPNLRAKSALREFLDPDGVALLRLSVAVAERYGIDREAYEGRLATDARNVYLVDNLARNVIVGDLRARASLMRLTRGLGAWDFPRGYPTPSEDMSLKCDVVVAPRSAHVTVAGTILGASFRDPELGQKLTYAHGLRRRGLDKIAERMRDVLDGRASESELARTVADYLGANLPEPERPGSGLPTPGDESWWPLPDEPFGAPDPFPELPPKPGIDFDLCELEWFECVTSLASPAELESLLPEVPEVGTATPRAVCADTPSVRFSIVPPAGTTFPVDVGRVSVALEVDWKLIPGTIVTWTNNLIEADFTGPLPPGCADFVWRLEAAEYARRINETSNACGKFIGKREEIEPVLSRFAFEVTLLAVDVQTFRADGNHPSLLAEACTDVALTWDVRSDVCSSLPAPTYTVEVLANGQVVHTTGSLNGQLLVNRDEDTTYELQVNAFDESGAQCATDTESVAVQREHRLHLSTSKVRIPAGSTLPLEVSISCLAPAPGVTVALQSSKPNRVSVPAEMTIPDGQVAVVVDAKAESECGSAQIVATAAGHTPEQRTLHSVHSPVILDYSPASIETCTTRTLDVEVKCAGFDGEAGVWLRKNGADTKLPQTDWVANAADAFHGPTTIQARAENLGVGQYQLVVKAHGHEVVSATSLEVTSKAPTINGFSSSPNKIKLCTPTTLALSWSVTNADRVIIREGSRVVDDRAHTTSCGPWSGTTSDPGQTEDTTYTLEARAGSRETTQTLTIQAASYLLLAKKIQCTNTGSSTRHLFLANAGANGSLVSKGAVGPNETKAVEVPKCEVWRVISSKTSSESAIRQNWSPNVTAETGLFLGGDVADRGWSFN